MDWTDVLILAPFVLLFGAFLFHAGGAHRLVEHILEHGHVVPPEREMIEPTLETPCQLPTLSSPQSPTAQTVL